MGQIAQKSLSDDQRDTNQTIPGTVTTPPGMGIFMPANTEKQPLGTGPIFTQDISLKTPTFDGIKAPTNANHNTLESFDTKKIVSILAQEVLKFGQLDNDRITEKDRGKILRALYELNPNKYGFIAANDEKFHPQDIIPQQELKRKKISSIIRPELATENLRLVKPTIPKTRNIPPSPQKKVPYSTKITPIPLTPSTSNRTLRDTTNTSNFFVRAGSELVEEKERVSPIATPFITQDSLESSKNQLPIIEDGVIHEVLLPQEKTLDTVPTSDIIEQEKSQKTQSVSKLIDILTTYFGEDWRKWAMAVSLGITSNEHEEGDNLILSGLSVEKMKSWRDDPKIKELHDFLNDISRT